MLSGTACLPYSVTAARDAAMAQVEKNSGPEFQLRAREFVPEYLRSKTWASGEEITDACKAAGITPHDDRAFGSVFGFLARRKVITQAGVCKRAKGHATNGGTIWTLSK